MTARVAADRGMTTTTARRIDALIEEASRLRREYRVATGRQRAPYFELIADRFALIVVDTGILRSVDDDQLAWLSAALERARGKFTFVILGHPLYAGGHYQGAAGDAFAALHRLLRRHRVDVVMAGDTHDLEYYREAYQEGAEPRAIAHFVNGGGGAYLSIGTALAWPARSPVPDAAFYPRGDAVVSKLDREVSWWKRPIWLWVKHLGGWPSTPEFLSAVFDFNAAPFFQSLVEVQVAASSDTVRLVPHGVHGPLRWRDLQIHGQVMPAAARPDDEVAFVLPMPPR
jgi:hypothetical protein